jgi:membrane protease YdiL (CAAX protease family)
MTLPNRRVLALVLAGLIGAFAVIPHLLMHLAEFASSGLVIVIAAGTGTRVAPSAGLGTPIIDAALTRRPFFTAAVPLAGISLVGGLLVALAVVVLDVAVFAQFAPRAPASGPAPWTGALAALYGGLTEEIVLRYGLMSMVVWVLKRLMRGSAAYWAAIFFAAMVFALWHLSQVAAATPLTQLLVARALVLNGLAGLVFGWLYWRRGLEAAMFSHGAAALVLHVAVPSIGI